MSEPGGKEWKRAEFLKGVGIVVVADIILAFAFFLEGGIRTDIGFLLLMGAYLI